MSFVDIQCYNCIKIKHIRSIMRRLLPRRTRGIFVPVLVSQSARGLDVEVTVQLVDEHQVDVELFAVELQTQISKSLHLQQGALQRVHRRHLQGLKGRFSQFCS